MIGSKGVSFFNSVGGNVVAQVTGMGDNPSLSELIGPVKVMLQAYDEGRLDKLYIVSNKFINHHVSGSDHQPAAAVYRIR